VNEPATFAGLVDLASADLGGAAIGASDDFFAGVENLVQPGRARFDPDRYTDRGKWMDGWESRRKRHEGHDWCVLRLGAVGRVMAFDIDTAYFVGNHPPYAAVDGLRADADTSLGDLLELAWRPLLAQIPLRAGAQNLFGAEPGDPVSHVRLSIYPDGGVARFRVFGRVEPCLAPPEIDERSRQEVPAGLVDLGALKNGASAVACSDARFGNMNSLLLPGRARHMGEGWETRRGRPPDHRHDWIIVRLAARGTLRVVEVDTNHYKGNFPERCSIDAVDWPDAKITELIQAARWKPLLAPSKLHADTRHFFGSDLGALGPITHVRLTIFPDGGVSRLRLWGAPGG
jgi:allantoicase